MLQAFRAHQHTGVLEERVLHRHDRIAHQVILRPPLAPLPLLGVAVKVFLYFGQIRKRDLAGDFLDNLPCLFLPALFKQALNGGLALCNVLTFLRAVHCHCPFRQSHSPTGGARSISGPCSLYRPGRLIPARPRLPGPSRQFLYPALLPPGRRSSAGGCFVFSILAEACGSRAFGAHGEIFPLQKNNLAVLCGIARTIGYDRGWLIGQLHRLPLSLYHSRRRPPGRSSMESFPFLPPSEQ